MSKQSEPTAAAKAELAAAARDYAAGAGSDMFVRADKETWRVGNMLAAQRGANKMFGIEKQPHGDQSDVNPHAAITWSDES